MPRPLRPPAGLMAGELGGGLNRGRGRYVYPDEQHDDGVGGPRGAQRPGAATSALALLLFLTPALSAPPGAKGPLGRHFLQSYYGHRFAP